MPPEFCLIYYRGGLQVGWLAGRQGAKWRLRLENGEAISYPAGSVLFSWDGEDTPPGEAPGEVAALAQLRGQTGPMKTRAGGLDLAAVEGALASGEALPFARLVSGALAPDSDGWGRAALFFALASAPARFSREGDRFRRVSAAESLRRAEQTGGEPERAPWLERVPGWRELLDRGEWPAGADADAEAFLAALESLIALGKGSPVWPELAKPLGLKASLMVEQAPRLKGWLETAGRWQGWPPVWLTAAGVANTFAPHLVARAAEAAAMPLQTADRTDYRGAHTISIDTAGTRDIDDAISLLEPDGDGMAVAVHIADPMAGLSAGGPVFCEAARRVSTVYTTEEIFPMLPEPLSTGRFSLLAGAERETVTFRLRIVEGEGSLVAVERAIVRVDANLDYRGADALVAENPQSWGRLAALCATLATRRAADGAHKGRRDGVHIDRSDPARLRLAPYSRQGPAQTLVEELAVLTNREAGRYCRRHGLPALYRVQEAAGPLADTLPAQRPAPVRYATSGAPHAGVACDRYVQVTSPIRRFPDLVMQHQIACHASGGGIAFAAGERLQGWGQTADNRLALHAAVEQRIDRHWKRLYLAQNLGQIFDGTVRRTTAAGLGKVWLADVLLMVDCHLPPHAQPGDAFSCRVLEVDIDRQRVEVEAGPERVR